jgi:hypothetical protein
MAKFVELRPPIYAILLPVDILDDAILPDHLLERGVTSIDGILWRSSDVL